MRKPDQPVQRQRMGRVIVTCAQCGATFETIRSQMERRGSKFNNKFHSRECWRAWRVENRQTRLAKLLKQQYRMTQTQYDAMLESQGGACSICGNQPGVGLRRLVVDHDHVMGRVRGLLCHGCNQALGRFNDDPLLLASAIRYLARRSDC